MIKGNQVDVGQVMEKVNQNEEETVRVRTTRKGNIYILEKGNGLIKIGASTRPHKRLKELSRIGGFEPKRKFISEDMSNYFAVENELHKIYSDKRAVGEWFEIDFDDAVNKFFECKCNPVIYETLTKKELEEMREEGHEEACKIVAKFIQPIPEVDVQGGEQSFVTEEIKKISKKITKNMMSMFNLARRKVENESSYGYLLEAMEMELDFHVIDEDFGEIGVVRLSDDCMIGYDYEGNRFNLYNTETMDIVLEIKSDSVFAGILNNIKVLQHNDIDEEFNSILNEIDPDNSTYSRGGK